MAVADWSQAKIGYTPICNPLIQFAVADWSQAKIGYTASIKDVIEGLVADWSQAKIGYTRLIEHRCKPWLRIGLRPRLVTLSFSTTQTTCCCGLVSGQDWLH